ncbi:MAG: sensor domain-containing diguanylate cyclase [Pseudomonadota bacterium]
MTKQSPPTGPAPKKHSLKRAALAFGILVTFFFVSFLVWNSWNARVTVLRQAETSTTNMTRALAQNANDIIGSVDNVIVGLVEILETDKLDAPHLERIHQFMQQRVSEIPLLHGLFVYDETGRWVVNSQKTLMKHLNNADREYFIYHRNSSDRGPHIGPPVRSRSTGEWIVTISRRLNHPDGSFAGVMLATVEMAYFRSFYESFDIGNSGAIVLLSDTGTLLVRNPFDEELIGKDLSKGPLFQEYLSHGPSGSAMLLAKVDKIERLYSYRHLDTYPLIISAALSKNEILANWRHQTIRLAAGGSLVIVLLWFLGLRLARQISIEEQTQTELGKAKEDLERKNEELAALALQDGLTGLANRRRFDVALETEYARAMRNAEPLALIILDVDRFKQYNDTYGHLQGDECLKKIAQALMSIPARPGDLVARYGGEEFAVLLPATSAHGAVSVAERIRCAVLDLGLTHTANAGGLVSISAGAAAITPLRNSVPQDLIRIADKALYVAKAEGRNRVSLSETI